MTAQDAQHAAQVWRMQVANSRDATTGNLNVAEQGGRRWREGERRDAEAARRQAKYTTADYGDVSNDEAREKAKTTTGGMAGGSAGDDTWRESCVSAATGDHRQGRARPARPALPASLGGLVQHITSPARPGPPGRSCEQAALPGPGSGRY